MVNSSGLKARLRRLERQRNAALSRFDETFEEDGVTFARFGRRLPNGQVLYVEFPADEAPDEQTWQAEFDLHEAQLQTQEQQAALREMEKRDGNETLH